MSVSPATLTTVANSGVWSASYVYIYDSTLSNGNHVYGLSSNGTSIDAGSEIQVDSNNNWSDYGSGTPAWAGVVGNEIEIRADSSTGPIRMKLVLPSSAPSSSTSGGGTGTEGTSTPSGTVVKIGTSANAATVKFTIDSSSPSSSGVISYQIIRDGVVYYTITGHTAGTPTETTIGWYNSSWELRMVSTSGLYETQTLDFILKEVNVSQNFW